jgi:hypothetical protein
MVGSTTAARHQLLGRGGDALTNNSAAQISQAYANEK